MLGENPDAKILAGGHSLISLMRFRLATPSLPKKRAASLGVTDAVKYPAGLDIGAVTPEEIALSILAEIVAHRRRSPAAEEEPARAKDPICGMMVGIEGARYTLEHEGQTHYFCGAGCKDAYELKHAD